MKCINCGRTKHILDVMKYCPYCGDPLLSQGETIRGRLDALEGKVDALEDVVTTLSSEGKRNDPFKI